MNLKKLLKLWLPVVFWCLLIFIGSSIPSPQPTKTFLDFILHKLFHLFEYAVLFILVYRATRNFGFALLFVISYAFSDEIHQSFVPTREPTLRDVFIDIVGGLLGWQFLLRVPLWQQKN